MGIHLQESPETRLKIRMKVSFTRIYVPIMRFMPEKYLLKIIPNRLLYFYIQRVRQQGLFDFNRLSMAL